MKLYAPRYYKNFKCIADKCEHSCCIGWEIDIDKKALLKYKKLKDGYGNIIADTISMDDTPHFKLVENERCPHLDEHGLCKIITNVGEEYLCDICREHPRFYNYTSIAEVGLGMSCEEAARIILSSSDYDAFEYIGEVDAEEDFTDFDGLTERGKIYKILRQEKNYKSRLEEIYSKYQIDFGNDETWLEILDSLEYLDQKHKDLFKNYSSKNRPSGKTQNEYLERFLAYLVYRHTTEAFDYEDFLLRLSFCLFCERLLASLICSKGAKELSEVATLSRIISEEIEYSEDNTEALM
ncbi:MAG: flagellin lysine-N-methylase [Clostridia bacterium]|nr:flagellin lysine-N-methylase [Clostridia bacterium]